MLTCRHVMTTPCRRPHFSLEGRTDGQPHRDEVVVVVISPVTLRKSPHKLNCISNAFTEALSNILEADGTEWDRNA